MPRCGSTCSPRSGHQQPHPFVTSNTRSRRQPDVIDRLEGTRPSATTDLDQAGVDLSFRSVGKPVPAILRSGRMSERLLREQAVRVAMGVEPPGSILLGIASGRFTLGLPDRTERAVVSPPAPVSPLGRAPDAPPVHPVARGLCANPVRRAEPIAPTPPRRNGAWAGHLQACPPRNPEKQSRNAEERRTSRWFLLGWDRVVARDGFEPPTPAFSGQRSTGLSYLASVVSSYRRRLTRSILAAPPKPGVLCTLRSPSRQPAVRPNRRETLLGRLDNGRGDPDCPFRLRLRERRARRSGLESVRILGRNVVEVQLACGVDQAIKDVYARLELFNQRPNAVTEDGPRSAGMMIRLDRLLRRLVGMEAGVRKVPPSKCVSSEFEIILGGPEPVSGETRDRPLGECPRPRG